MYPRFQNVVSRFWIVVGEESGMSAYPARHATEELAFAEAERLASLHPGRFYVFEAKGVSKRVEIHTRKFGEGDDSIPF